jgi:hypothetical protein
MQPKKAPPDPAIKQLGKVQRKVCEALSADGEITFQDVDQIACLHHRRRVGFSIEQFEVFMAGLVARGLLEERKLPPKGSEAFGLRYWVRGPKWNLAAEKFKWKI